MLFRLVRPVRRKGSRVPYFVQRIPADVKPYIEGGQFTIPLGDTFHKVTLRPGANDIRFSLRTTDPSEAKIRHAAVAAHLENVWRTFREKTPVTLTHKQATALAGALYRRGQTVTATAPRQVEHTPGQGWRRVDVSDDEEIAIWEAAQQHVKSLATKDDLAALEKHLGPLVDSLLLGRGIRRVDAQTRRHLLSAFLLALRDAVASRKRNAEGDYAPKLKGKQVSGMGVAAVPTADRRAATSGFPQGPGRIVVDRSEGNGP